MRRSLAYGETSLKEVQIDYAEKGTVEAVLKTLDEKDEPTVLFGLDLVEDLDPNDIVARLPRGLLHHSSPAVRARAIKLFATHPDPTTLKEISQMLQDENKEVQAQAISAACAIFKGDAIAVVRPYLESPESQVKGRAVECLLRHGDAVTRAEALISFRQMVNDNSAKGVQSRVEACRLMGELYDPEFSTHLGRLITEDKSHTVIDAAMAAAGLGKYPGVVRDIILRLGSNATKAAAREALTKYGEIAVKELRTALFDSQVAHDIRLYIPRTLSKIHSQLAMNALLGALIQEDRSIRFQAILAVEEMARRFADMKVDREIVESAIMSDALLYYRRFVIFIGLFGQQEKSLGHQDSLLYFALTDSMERVKERMMWLLSLIYPPKDIRRFWAGVNSQEPNKQADAIEFLDNLLRGEIKAYVFPLFSDVPQAQRFKASLGFFGMGTIDTDSALRALLDQDDIWLRAATVWEIRIRGLTGFSEKISELLDSENVVVREAAGESHSQKVGLVMEQETLTSIEKVIFLKSVDIFKHAAIEELGGVAALTEEVHFSPGETIYREGEPVDAIYLVLKGRVAVEGKGQVIRQVGEKQAFGTVGALDLNPAIHTVSAIDPVSALKLNAQDLQDLLSQDFELVQAVIRALCQLVREFAGR